MGNLRSVQKAIEHTGTPAIVSGDPVVLSQSSHLVLPGVGAFGDAIQELKRRGLVSLIRDWAQSTKPFLGICLGMQLLFDTSDEGGLFEGLGILPGKVVRFDPPGRDEDRKVPHMGWNQVVSTYSPDVLLEGLAPQPFFYFVHSYFVVPSDPNVEWLRAEYGTPFCAAVRSGNLLATQFHPEKSQRDGLQLIANFLKM
jgi:glutamine amidotransferase